ncbi:MAG: hypothetical protein IJM59_13345 [Proteobacteria bacterium]|nr:hypothetical protein [Pseudomonadota bacterium]
MARNIPILRFILLLTLAFAAFFVCPGNAAWAQESPDVGAPASKSKSSVSPALRGFSEFGMGVLFGTLSGGSALITGILVNPMDIRPALISAAILYPAGIGCGAILGGYLTDTKSSYWEPFVGAFSGALIADVTAYFLAEDYPIFSAILVIALPLVTTLIAMETSHAWRDREDKHRDGYKSSSQAIMPLSFGFGF